MRSRRRIASVGFGDDSSDVLDLGLVALAVAGSIVAMTTSIVWFAIVAAVPSLVADVLRTERPVRLRRFRRILFDRPERSLLRNGALAIAVAATPPLRDFVSIAVLLVTVMVLHGALTAYSALGTRRIGQEEVSITWRHLDVGGAEEGPGPLPDPVQDLLPIDGLRLISASELLVVAGFAVTAAGGVVVPWVLAAGSLALASGCVGAAISAWLLPSGHPLRRTDREVAAAVADLAPEVVFYFSSPASGTYALSVWATVINAIERPVLVVLREPVHLDGVAEITRPIVVAPFVSDLIAVTPASVRVVLYPTNVVRNNEMVRLPGPMHCFIGHGDSDKVGSFSPLNRMYDEIWVAGGAAVDRYAAVDEGIDLAVVRAVGRPQLADIARAGATEDRPAGRPVVLYAPTWEGFFDEADYSSVASIGVGIVRTCLDAGWSVLFKPHPLTGHRLLAAANARVEIEAALRAAGDAGEVVAPGPDSLYGAFNRADVLISDISSVITDFLASRKPYLVTNRRDLPEDEFRRVFPSTSAADLIGSDLAGLQEALVEAIGADPRRAQREALAEYLLGAERDPMRAFLREIDDFVARSEARAIRSIEAS